MHAVDNKKARSVLEFFSSMRQRMHFFILIERTFWEINSFQKIKIKRTSERMRNSEGENILFVTLSLTSCPSLNISRCRNACQIASLSGSHNCSI